VLTATGTPTAGGANSFTLNTTPNCSFNRTTVLPSSNGSAVVSAFTCSTASAGTLIAGTAASGVTQTITATVTTVGTYNISTTANGVTFTASGTFAGTGAQDIVLTATGTPTALGTNTFTLNTTPNCSFNRTTQSLSSNGTAVVSAYSCSTASAGTLIAGTAASGVTQTITATVTSVGTYNISTTTNGVTFAGSGTFSGTGSQNIVLTATGTQTAVATNTFTLNTTPNCSFSRTTIYPSSNGSSVVSAYSCSTASAGTLIAGTAALGVTQTITATVTQAGTYSISTTANGVTFAASGTFASTGAQNIVLTATGTPTAGGANSFTLNTTPNCSFSRTTVLPSSNGSAVVSAYSCSTASAGTLTAGIAVSGVTQTITATVTTVGTYNISTTSNGVTFAASGTFASTGAQDIVLTATGTPTVGGNVFTYSLNTNPNCSFGRLTLNPLPGNITLSAVSPYFISSVYDQDYLPYATPTGPATLTSPIAAGGGNETSAMNFQGTLTTTGVTIAIPYTVLTATVTLLAYNQTITIPAAATQDGISRDITFSYAGGTYPVGTGHVFATIKSVGGTLNAKQLDIQSGIGNDNLGYLMGWFTYSTNGSGGVANLQVRDIAGIPDRNMTNANHLLLYVPVTGADGNIWLNNNLGADYNNVTNAAFNPAQQATAANDYHAYGSLFQWGRFSDGHELISWTSATSGTAVNGTTNTLATSDTPGNSFYIITVPSSNYDWRNPYNNALWQGESGVNNPCPVGFRLPTDSELTGLITASSITNNTDAANSTLKIPNAGDRISGTFLNNGVSSLIWSSTVLNNNEAYYKDTDSSRSVSSSLTRGQALSVRCIKN
jgi:hypothetical protein